MAYCAFPIISTWECLGLLGSVCGFFEKTSAGANNPNPGLGSYNILYYTCTICGMDSIGDFEAWEVRLGESSLKLC